MNEQCFYKVCTDKLVTYVEFDDGISVRLIDYMGYDYRVVESARVSYNLNDRSKGYEKDFELLQRLMNDGHLGPFEHISATVLITMPIFTARQVMRTRTASYNELSRRYTKSGIEFWLPPEEQIRFTIKKDEELSREYLRLLGETYSVAMKNYRKSLDMGVAKELARVHLPVGLMTKVYMTANVRNWLHFLDLRLDEHAQYEAREVGQGVKQILESIFPHVFYAWQNSKNRGAW